MAKHPDIASTYDTWHAIKSAAGNEASTSDNRKSKQSSSTSSSSKQRSDKSKSNSTSSKSKNPSSSSSSNPFKTPTKPKASSIFKTPTSNHRSTSESAPQDPFKTPSKSTPNHSFTTPKSIVKAKMPSPSPTTNSNASRFYSKTTINSPARLKAAIASHSTTSPNRLGSVYTPRTKARKRLRGEEVPPTPDGLSNRPTKKRFGSGSLNANLNSIGEDEPDTGGSLKVDGHGNGSGAFRNGLAERKISNGKNGINALLANKGKGKEKELPMSSKNMKSLDNDEMEDDEDEDVIGASPIRPAIGKEAEKKFKPLFGGQGLFGSQLAESSSKSNSNKSRNLQQEDSMDIDMDLEEGDEIGEKLPSSSTESSISNSDSNPSSPTHSTDNTTPMDETMASNEVIEPEKKSKKVTKLIPQVYTTEISDDEGAEVEAKKAWEAVRSKKKDSKSNGKGKGKSVEFKDQDEEMKGISPSKKTTIVIRPYQRNGTLDHRTLSNSSNNSRNSSTPTLEAEQEDEDDDEHYGILDYSSNRRFGSQQPQSQSPQKPTSSLPRTLAGLSLISPKAKGQKARMSEKNSQRAYLKSLFHNDYSQDDLYERETKELEAEIESTHASKLEQDKLLINSGGVGEGEGEVESKKVTWGEAKANAKDKNLPKQKGKGRGKPNSHKTKKEREEEERKEKEKELKSIEKKKRLKELEEKRKRGLVFNRAGRSGVGDDEDSGKKNDYDEDEDEDQEDDSSDVEVDDEGQERDFEEDEDGEEEEGDSSFALRGRGKTKRKKRRNHEESDEDWASEVSSEEYGLGDGRMDNDDVL